MHPQEPSNTYSLIIVPEPKIKLEGLQKLCAESSSVSRISYMELRVESSVGAMIS